MGVLADHHHMLAKLNTINFPLSDKIFDYFLYLSSADEAED